MCCVPAKSIKLAHEMVQRRQRNVQNSVIHVQSCCLLTYAVLLAVAVVVGFVVILKWCCHRNVTSHLLSIVRFCCCHFRHALNWNLPPKNHRDVLQSLSALSGTSVQMHVNTLQKVNSKSSGKNQVLISTKMWRSMIEAQLKIRAKETYELLVASIKILPPQNSNQNHAFHYAWAAILDVFENWPLQKYHNIP